MRTNHSFVVTIEKQEIIVLNFESFEMNQI